MVGGVCIKEADVPCLGQGAEVTWDGLVGTVLIVVLKGCGDWVGKKDEGKASEASDITRGL